MGRYGNADGVLFYESDVENDTTMVAGNASGIARAIYRYCDCTTTTVRVLVYYDFSVTANSFQGSVINCEYAPTLSEDTSTWKYATFTVYSGSYGPVTGGATAIPDANGSLYTDCGVFQRGTNFLLHNNWYYWGSSGTLYQSYCSHQIYIPTITEQADLAQECGMVIYDSSGAPRLVKDMALYL